nr:hypothetical protein [Bradyrhizobium sp. WSM1743]
MRYASSGLQPDREICNQFACASPDWDPKQSAISRRKFFASVADTDTLILPIHFPAPTVGWIKPLEGAFDYKFKRE